MPLVHLKLPRLWLILSYLYPPCFWPIPLFLNLAFTHVGFNALSGISHHGVFVLVLSGDVSLNPGTDSRIFTGCLLNVRSIRNESGTFFHIVYTKRLTS